MADSFDIDMVKIDPTLMNDVHCFSCTGVDKPYSVLGAGDLDND